MSEPEVRWAGGARGRIVALEADAIVLRSPVAAAPGSSLEGCVPGTPDVSLRVKIRACRRQPEGDFLLRGRPIDLTRVDRARIERLVEGGSAPP